MQSSQTSQLENILLLKGREQGQDLSEGLDRSMISVQSVCPDVLTLDLNSQFLSDDMMQLRSQGGLLPFQQFEQLY